MKAINLLIMVPLAAGIAACGGARSNMSSSPPSHGRAPAARGDARSSAADVERLGPPLSLALTERLIDHAKVGQSAVRSFSVVFGASYGQLPAPAEGRLLTKLVKRYYGFAARGDGRRACAMIVPSRARAFPAEYTRQGSLPYLRGANTCQEVLTRMFRRGHGVLEWPVKVTGVLVKGQYARAFIDSRTTPVSVLPLQHSGGAWRVAAPLAGTLPVTGFKGPFPLSNITR